ncbi:hypothetical protein [Nocardiopsis suaedae]|uniref:DUF4352 domain-containing protein n=1 Tax=Nocardiopsis suaedae TaxID=3018444 RepID=A0ABT4TRU1_9ACTN|nr:hypothetical protein [Nocardiopsis suaedae]MDA2807389.1 hypothetical protein [Nocardiopsis suaedae]
MSSPINDTVPLSHTGPATGTPARRRVATALAAGGLTVVLTGCSMLGGDGGEEAAPEGEASPVNAGKVDPGEAEARETIASQDVATLGTDLHIAVHSLARGEKTVELTFSVTNTGEEESEIFHTWLGAASDEYNVSGVKLVDSANGKVHLPARDEDGDCVCSTYGGADELGPGDSILYSATYGAPPQDVETMDVKIPTAGSFDNVPLS